MTKTELENKVAEMQEQFDKLQDELNKLKQVKIEEPKKRWKPELDEIYHSVGMDGIIYHINWDDSTFDNWRYLTGNVFKTQKEALEYKKKLEIQARFKDFVEERSEELRYEDDDQEKFYLYYDYEDRQIIINTNEIFKSQGTIYASSEQILLDAIEEIGEENIKKYVLEVEE